MVKWHGWPVGSEGGAMEQGLGWIGWKGKQGIFKIKEEGKNSDSYRTGDWRKGQETGGEKSWDCELLGNRCF